MSSYAVRMDSGYLYHHGIEGQKWGIKNGPPYPIKNKIPKSRIETNLQFFSHKPSDYKPLNFSTKQEYASAMKSGILYAEMNNIHDKFFYYENGNYIYGAYYINGELDIIDRFEIPDSVTEFYEREMRNDS